MEQSIVNLMRGILNGNEEEVMATKEQVGAEQFESWLWAISIVMSSMRAKKKKPSNGD